ncbi:MAG: permease [Sulfuriferula sp.]|nr:permease [Sulfuriferula sp.]
MEIIEQPPIERTHIAKWLAGAALGLGLWIALYSQLQPLADYGMSLTGIAAESHLGQALNFFLFETPKVLMLLALIVFVMGVIQTYVAPERTRQLLSGRRLGIGNVMAASLGIVTPFCSCSAVPLFIGFLQAGVPLGVTFSFLISAPMVNEIALGLLFGLFGWKIALLYMGLGLTIAIVAGLVIGKLGMEKYLEDWVQAIQAKGGAVMANFDHNPSWPERFQAGISHLKDIVGKVWPYIVLGVAVGAGIHGYVPQNFMAAIMGKGAWWSVPAAVLIGVPMYSNAAGIIPVVQALLGKGAALGTVLAFMMSVTALSFPEMIILRKVLKPVLIATFTGIVATGILLVGYIFNAVL